MDVSSGALWKRRQDLQVNAGPKGKRPRDAVGPEGAELVARAGQNPTDEARIKRIAGEVAEVCRAFPAPGIVV